MRARPYQDEIVEAVARDFREHQKLLIVAATGSGKTIVASMIMDDFAGRCLFIADAQELVKQNADKFRQYTGRTAAIEMADQKVTIREDDFYPDANPDIVVATTQSIVRRLSKYHETYFDLIIIDEAHRNTLGAQAQQVLDHFPAAKVLGMTATPFRADRKKLGDFYEKISSNIGLERLIREGYLSRITIKSVPVPIDLDDVRTTAGDYNAGDLGTAMEPHLEAAADILVEHASDRKTVVFLPLIKTSQAFTKALCDRGIRAVHVDGMERGELQSFHNGDADVICNASLLSTGWDHPPVDCVYILRPTKSQSLFCQQVGRGTRVHPGKEDLLLLDPLYLTDDHKLITPSRLLATSDEEAQAIDNRATELTEANEEWDLVDNVGEIREERADRLREELLIKADRSARTVDAMAFALSVGDNVIADYEPEMGWELRPVTAKQAEVLEKSGFDSHAVTCCGQASKVLDILFDRRERGLATPKQLRLINKFGYKDAHLATFEQASGFIDRRLSQ